MAPSPQRPLVVVQVLPALNAGGVERCTLETARALVDAGHRSIVVSSGGRLVPRLEQEGSRHVPLPVHRKSPLSLLQVRPLRRLLAELAPDIVHVRSRVPAWITWFALRGLPAGRRPHFVTTLHGLHSVSRYSAIMARGEVVIAGSQTVRDYLLAHFGAWCPPERIRLIPEGVDPAEFPYGHVPDADWLAAWRAQFPELAGKTVLALPGRLTRLKGHATFIDLLAALRDAHPGVHGLVIGGAEAGKEAYEREIRARARDAGLDGRLTFTGHRSDMRDVLSQCDLVFSLSTQPETFGRTVLEAIRLGKPVIGWNVGGVGEILAACYPRGRVAALPDLSPGLPARGAPAPDAFAALVDATRQWLAAPSVPPPCAGFTLSAMCERTIALYREVAGA